MRYLIVTLVYYLNILSEHDYDYNIKLIRQKVSEYYILAVECRLSKRFC